ncbi:MAG: 50S ribosomal protein L13 [Spirochaetia bacterium]|jgi:large subunit ribosomal protein L13|nr:50S ribosomal protein L13 [Spirochaetia bacterium]
MKTLYVKLKDIKRKWYLIDASGKTLGSVAVKVASLLRGKHKPLYVPHQEIGDYVIVINAAKIAVTGRKRTDKIYYNYSGYVGGMKARSFEKVMAKKPAYPLETAIRGMLPKNRLGRKLFGNAKVYAGESHPHAAQQPETLEI